jgi:hypothetical protein
MARLWSIALLLIIGGCQTAAQQESLRLSATDKATVVATRSCITDVIFKPAYSELRARLHFNPDGSPSLAQLSDRDTPTDEDVANLYSAHDELQPCRKIALEGAGQIHPLYVALLAENFRRTDEIFLGLARRESTWGQANVAIQQLQAWGKQQQAEMSAEIAANLQITHEQELARRAAVGNALQQWSFQQQALANQRAAVDALNRPRTMNCRYLGPTVNCTQF